MISALTRFVRPNISDKTGHAHIVYKYVFSSEYCSFSADFQTVWIHSNKCLGNPSGVLLESKIDKLGVRDSHAYMYTVHWIYFSEQCTKYVRNMVEETANLSYQFLLQVLIIVRWNYRNLLPRTFVIFSNKIEFRSSNFIWLHTMYC